MKQLQKMIELRERREIVPGDWLVSDLNELDELIRKRRHEVNMAAAQAMADDLASRRI